MGQPVTVYQVSVGMEQCVLDLDYAILVINRQILVVPLVSFAGIRPTDVSVRPGKCKSEINATL